MADIVDEVGLSNGAIYRYFRSKEEIVVAVCEQASGELPKALTPAALSRESGHARLISQIYAEAALSPAPYAAALMAILEN